MKIERIGIMGAGTMGNGIAQAFAVAGLHSAMIDVSNAAGQSCHATIADSLQRLVK